MAVWLLLMAECKPTTKCVIAVACFPGWIKDFPMPRPVLGWEKRLGRRFTLHDLHILKAVAQSGSIAQAARALGMSQPSVSEASAHLHAALPGRVLHPRPPR